MKNKTLSSMAKWFIVFAAFALIGFFIHGFLGALIAIFLYLIINCVLFWGKAAGILGYIFHLALKKSTVAEKFYKIAINQQQTTTTALTSYGMLLLRRGDPETALNLFERAEKQSGNNIILLKSSITNKALCYWQKGDVDKAIEILLDCIKRFEYLNPDIYETLGYFYILKEDYDKALEFTNKALEDNPNHAASLDNLGQIYYRLNDYDKAQEYFNKAISNKDMADSYYYLGIIEEQKGNLENAKNYFEKANSCKITPFNTVTKEQVNKKYSQYISN